MSWLYRKKLLNLILFIYFLRGVAALGFTLASFTALPPWFDLAYKAAFGHTTILLGLFSVVEVPLFGILAIWAGNVWWRGSFRGALVPMAILFLMALLGFLVWAVYSVTEFQANLVSGVDPFFLSELRTRILTTAVAYIANLILPGLALLLIIRRGRLK